MGCLPLSSPCTRVFQGFPSPFVTSAPRTQAFKKNLLSVAPFEDNSEYHVTRLTVLGVDHIQPDKAELHI